MEMDDANEAPCQISQARDVAMSAARVAGALILEYFEKPELQAVEFKGKRDPVTEADRLSERLIRQRILGAFPDHSFLGEEDGGHGDSGKFMWYVDPLDGTVNFAHGLPIFAVSIALAHEGEIQLGVIYAPKLDELFVATRGGGAFLNGRPLSVSKTSTVENSIVSTGFAYKRDELVDNNVEEFNRVILKVRGLRRCGAAAWDLANVAAGRFEAHWEKHLSPWDVAAGSLVVQEAGGLVSDLDGGDSFLHSGSILATNGRVHGAMSDLLKGT